MQKSNYYVSKKSNIDIRSQTKKDLCSGLNYVDKFKDVRLIYSNGLFIVTNDH